MISSNYNMSGGNNDEMKFNMPVQNITPEVDLNQLN
jgi:hypothetical protein